MSGDKGRSRRTKTRLPAQQHQLKEQYAALKDKYDQLCELSQQRRAHLASLYEYVQSCRKELSYLSGQQERILQRDWSDRLVDAPSVRMEYEKFKTQRLLSHEKRIIKLRGKGDGTGEGENSLKRNILPASTIKDTAASQRRCAVGVQAFLNLVCSEPYHLDTSKTTRVPALDGRARCPDSVKLNSNLTRSSQQGRATQRS
nr:PREDICTED: periplakin-like [Notothenia coriiceps]